MTRKLERECQVCQDDFEVGEGSINSNGVKRLCEKCKSLRKAIKSGEGGARTNTPRTKIKKKDTEKIASKISYTLVKLNILYDILEERGDLEWFEKTIQLPDARKSEQVGS